MGNPRAAKSKPILLRELSELKSSEIILKFHWVDGLTTHPLTKLEWVNLADDPIPFIKLVNPPAALTLSVESSLGSLFARRPGIRPERSCFTAD